jgi:hypothetical protein
MKRSILAALFVVTAFFSAQAGDPPVKKESPTVKVQACGPTFIAYNDMNLPVQTIELRNFYTGYSTTVYNPQFPYDFGERETGSYIFIVTFAAPLEGSIFIKPDEGTSYCSGPKWEASWSMLWSTFTCIPNRIKILPDISCRE